MSWLQRLLFGESRDERTWPAPSESPAAQLNRVIAHSAPVVPYVRGPGTFAFDIVGESFYQDALQRIAGPKTPEGHEHFCRAELRPEPQNPHDRNAVAVFIDGQKVGHLSRADAQAYVAMLHRLGASNRTYEVSAKIVGGWLRSRSEGHYGVKLDIDAR